MPSYTKRLIPEAGKLSKKPQKRNTGIVLYGTKTVCSMRLATQSVL